jgi:hypothetical protein
MTDQAPLPFEDLAPVAKQATDAETAAAFLAANPALRRWLIDQAIEHDRIGIRVPIKYLVEAARVAQHKAQLVRTAKSPWLINNSWVAYFARILMAEEPRLEGYFTIRHAQFDEEAAAA